jgi:hypothetical protein
VSIPGQFTENKFGSFVALKLLATIEKINFLEYAA